MSEPAYRCERCSAPLEVSPETIVAICPYCGYPNHISGTLSVKDVWIVPSLSLIHISEPTRLCL
ncbi:MAG: hypothetical protein QI199_02315, partial [Candidatus Korarchaeota archaeon]|nr:hypothetical protein [Candidatus Korarchaeota archaeon]